MGLFVDMGDGCKKIYSIFPFPTFAFGKINGKENDL